MAGEGSIAENREEAEALSEVMGDSNAAPNGSERR